MRIFAANTVKDIFTPFFISCKLLGFSTFAYPSKAYRWSIWGTGSWILNICIRLYFLQIFFTYFRGLFKLNLAKIDIIGIVIIESLVHFTAPICQIISFCQRIQLYRMLKSFESFDDKVSKTA